MPREGTLRHQRPDPRRRASSTGPREQDHVIQRADGTCLYHLANVVDDYDFKITHVIRAEEHLSNTPRQIFIAQSLGYALPEYAHLPFVAEPGSKTKLSKRKLDKYLKNPDFAALRARPRWPTASDLRRRPSTFNPVVVDFYEQVGYLPEAIINYLALLGWSLDDKTEFFTRDEMIATFSLERVNKAPASFDPKKLWAFQERYMQLPLAQKIERACRILTPEAGLVPEPGFDVRPRLATKIIADAGPRFTVAGDVLNYADFFTADERLPYDEKAFDKHVRKAADLLRKAQAVLAATRSRSTRRRSRDGSRSSHRQRKSSTAGSARCCASR